MKRKAIEKIPWQSHGNRKKMMVAASVHDIGSEEILIVDFALDKPVLRIALSHNDFENFIPSDSPSSESLPRWGRRQYDTLRSEGFGIPHVDYPVWSKLADRKTADLIHCFAYGKDDPYHTVWHYDIDHIQRNILSDRQMRAEHRRNDRIKKKMATVPEPRNRFRKWAVSVVENHIMYMLPFRKKKTTKTLCSACQTQNEFERGTIKPGKLAVCSSCGAKCTVKRVDYENQNPVTGYRFSKEVLLFQKIDDEFCERHFSLAYHADINGEHMDMVEIGRIFYPAGSFSSDWKGDPETTKDKKQSIYFNKYNPWTGETFWDDRNLSGCSVIVLRNGPVYTRNITKKMFEGTRYQYCAMELVKNRMSITPIDYLKKYDRMPQAMEMFVKMGMYRMAAGLSLYDFNGDGKPWERLGISKKNFNRLRHINGGRRALNWMRYEDGTGKTVDDETIKFFERESIDPDDISFVMDRMSGRQIMNCITRQHRQRKTDTKEILRLWRDYLSMASRMKMDVQKEIVYKPADIKQAHDDLVKLCDNRNVMKRADEIVQKYPDVDDILWSIREKYEYSDDKYAVVVPKKIEDIIYEGRTLGHCLDKSDIYFDRIQRRESFIVFLRRMDDIKKPYYTMEIEPDGTTRQKRTTGDRQDKDFQEAVSFIRKWQGEVKKRLDRNDKNLAAQSAKLREEEFKELRKNQTKVWHGMLAGKLLADVLEADLMVASEH